MAARESTINWPRPRLHAEGPDLESAVGGRSFSEAMLRPKITVVPAIAMRRRERPLQTRLTFRITQLQRLSVFFSKMAHFFVAGLAKRKLRRMEVR